MHPLAAEIAAEADPEDAAVLARFFQVRPGGYGEGDHFVGVRQSRLRRLARPYARERFDPPDWVGMLESRTHEHRMVALIVMADRMARADAAERDAIVETYLAHLDAVDNWDLVDASAAPILGAHVLDRDRTPLDALVASPSLWERRIGIVATHHLIRAGETADTYRLATHLLGDREDLIHKAVGWMLREAGARVDRDELRRFLDRHAAAMPRTTLRYAIEHLPPVERQHYLAVKRTPGEPGARLAP